MKSVTYWYCVGFAAGKTMRSFNSLLEPGAEADYTIFNIVNILDLSLLTKYLKLEDLPSDVENFGPWSIIKLSY